MDIWSPQVGEFLEVQAEPDNSHDAMAVAVRKDEHVVGHLPKWTSRFVFYFLLKEDSAVTCEVASSKVNCGLGLGLEILCVYHSSGRNSYVD